MTMSGGLSRGVSLAASSGDSKYWAGYEEYHGHDRFDGRESAAVGAAQRPRAEVSRGLRGGDSLPGQVGA